MAKTLNSTAKQNSTCNKNHPTISFEIRDLLQRRNPFDKRVFIKWLVFVVDRREGGAHITIILFMAAPIALSLGI